MVAAGAAAGVALERKGALFAGPVVPELVAAMINGGTLQVEMFADGEPIVEVSDDLGLVFLHLNDDELEDVQQVLSI